MGKRGSAGHGPSCVRELAGQRVRVHLDRTQKVQVITDGKENTLCTADSVRLKDVEFFVSQARHEWINANQKRKVGAWAWGTVMGDNESAAGTNPADPDTYLLPGGRPAKSAQVALLTPENFTLLGEYGAPPKNTPPRDEAGVACIRKMSDLQVNVTFDRARKKYRLDSGDDACYSGTVKLADAEFDTDNRTVIGTVLDYTDNSAMPSVSYNPFKYPYWYRRKDESKIDKARMAVLVVDPRDDTSVLEGWKGRRRVRKAKKFRR